MFSRFKKIKEEPKDQANATLILDVSVDTRGEDLLDSILPRRSIGRPRLRAPVTKKPVVAQGVSPNEKIVSKVVGEWRTAMAHKEVMSEDRNIGHPRLRASVPKKPIAAQGMSPREKIDSKMVEKWRAAMAHKKVVLEDIIRLKEQLAEALKQKEELVLECDAVMEERSLLAERYLDLMELKSQQEKGTKKNARKRRATEGSGPAERLMKA